MKKVMRHFCGSSQVSYLVITYSELIFPQTYEHEYIWIYNERKKERQIERKNKKRENNKNKILQKLFIL